MKHGVIVVELLGKHTGSEAESCVCSVRAFLDECGKPTEVVGDLSGFRGFDNDARKVWQELMSTERERVLKLTVVNGSALAGMATSAVSLFAKIEMRRAASLEDVYREAGERTG